MLRRYITYSFTIHIAFLGWFLIHGLTKESKKVYYTVDFRGGPISGRPKGGGQKKAQEAKVKASTVDPKEDLLIKSKKKSRKKQTVRTVPSVPSIPVPKPPAEIEENLPEIPGTPALPDSGIGIGFGEGGFGVTSGAGNFPYTWYVHTIKKKLDANWKVTGGFSRRIYTQVVFTIQRNGSLTDIEVEESSGNEVFDRAAVRAVMASDPYPPLPKDFPEPIVKVHIQFSVRGRP